MSSPLFKTIAGIVAAEAALCAFGNTSTYGGDRVPQCSVPAAVSCTPAGLPTGAPPATAPGMYAQPPATGAFEGESSGIGVRGPVIQFPEVKLQLPTLHMPSLFKIKRGAQLNLDSGTAPFVTGAPAPFGMLATAPAPMGPPAGYAPQAPTGGPPPTGYPMGCPPTNCSPVPPAPVCEPGMALERRLYEQLLRKEEELNEMSRRVERMESLMSQMTPASQPSPEPNRIAHTNYEQPALLASTPSAPRASRPLSAPVPGGQKRTATSSRQAEVTPVRQSAAPSHLSPPQTAEENAGSFGEWNGTAKSTTRTVQR